MLKMVIQSGAFEDILYLLINDDEGKKRIILSDCSTDKLIDYQLNQEASNELAADFFAVVQVEIPEPEEFSHADTSEKFMHFHIEPSDEFGFSITITKKVVFVLRSDRTIKRGLPTYNIRFIYMAEIIEISCSEQFVNNLISALQRI